MIQAERGIDESSRLVAEEMDSPGVAVKRFHTAEDCRQWDYLVDSAGNNPFAPNLVSLGLVVL